MRRAAVRHLGDLSMALLHAAAGWAEGPTGSDIFQTEWQQTDQDDSFLREFERTGVSALRRLEEGADTKRGMASQPQRSGELPRQGVFHHRGDLALLATIRSYSSETGERQGSPATCSPRTEHEAYQELHGEKS